MKRECPSLFAALLVSLLVNVLLRSQTAYWPRAGLFSAVVCAPLLAGVGWLFARSWPPTPCTSCCSAHCSSTHRY